MAVKFEDEHKVRGTIRDIIRDNKNSKGLQFRSYIAFLLQIRREIDGHLRNKGVTNDAIYYQKNNRKLKKCIK